MQPGIAHFTCFLLHGLIQHFAKEQMLLFLRDYMHPNGQIPAYEWEFGDVNPPTRLGLLARLSADRPTRQAR